MAGSAPPLAIPGKLFLEIKLCTVAQKGGNMTVFEKVKISDNEIRVNAYPDDQGPKQKLAIERFATDIVEYGSGMIIDKDIWYLMRAINEGLVTEGQTVTVLDGAPDAFDLNFIKAV